MHTPTTSLRMTAQGDDSLYRIRAGHKFERYLKSRKMGIPVLNILIIPALGHDIFPQRVRFLGNFHYANKRIDFSVIISYS